MRGASTTCATLFRLYPVGVITCYTFGLVPCEDWWCFMCMFCAAIPTAGAVGAALNNKQIQRLRQARELDAPEPAPRPIVKITTGVMALLLVGSITYHTIQFGP